MDTQPDPNLPADSSSEALADEADLAAYLAGVSERLAARRQERVTFLRGALAQLEAMARQARLLHDEELESSLAQRIAVARSELAALEGTAAGAVNSGGTGPAAAPRAPGQFTTRPVAPGLATPPPAASTGNCFAGRLAPAVATAPGSRSPSPGAPLMSPAARSAVARSPAPAWEPRPLADLQAELDRLLDEVERLDDRRLEGDPGLLRLKALACRQRRIRAEFQAHGLNEPATRSLYVALQDRQAQWGNAYVLPLDTHVNPADPHRWEELARGYESLALAAEAMAWYDRHSGLLHANESQRLLEGIGASQTIVYRLITRYFPASDRQQQALFASVKAAAAAVGVSLTSLDPQTETPALQELVASLPVQYEHLRAGVERRESQRETVERLMLLAAHADPGKRSADAEALRAAALACLAAGIPESDRRLRDALLPFESALADEPRLARLVEDLQRERERRTTRDTPADEDDEGPDSAFSPEVQKALEELLPYTSGKRCLFVGGVPREEKRREIAEALKMDLIWPDATKQQGIFDYEADIIASDIVVLLIRFMRTGFGQADELCDKYGKRLVRLPRGLGLTRVITEFHDQLVPRTSAAAAS
jgi:hypothetical protein